VTRVYESLKNRESTICRDLSEQIKCMIGDLYKLDHHEIFTGSSGTDLELIALYLSGLSQQKAGVNIIVGSNEVGSGIDDASKGCHFSSKTPKGRPVVKSSPIPGLSIEASRIYSANIRHTNGALVNKNDFLSIIKKKLNTLRNAREPVLLHGVYGSKTGAITLNVDDVTSLRSQFGYDISILIDVCQARVTPRTLNQFLDLGCMVIITGSKFLGGPPFSGALVCPKRLISCARQEKTLPRGLANYFSK